MSKFLSSSEVGGISNPYNGILSVIDLETEKYFSVNDELEKIDNFENSELNKTNITGNVLCDGVVTDKITDATELVRIDLDDTDVNVVSQNFTYNGADIITKPDLEPLETKTFYIDGSLHNDGTVFNQNIYAEKFIVSGSDLSNPSKLLSDGSLSNVGDLIFLNQGEPVNGSVDKSYMDRSLNVYASSDAGFPIAGAIPSYSESTIFIANENDLMTAEYGDYYTLVVTNSFTITATQSFNRKIKLQGINQNIKLSCNLATSMFNLTLTDICFDNITLNNSNTGSSATILSFVGANNNGYVTNCIFETNEFAMSSNLKNLQVNNNIFKFVGTADSHRYIILSGCSGNCFITNNIFEGNATASSTQCVNINNGLASAFLNGSLIMKNNISQTFPVQRLLMVDISMTNSNFSIYASSNNMSCTSGFILFYSLPLDGIKQIYLYNNTETLGGTATGSKGLIGLDSPSNSVISFNTKIYSSKNTVPLLRADYTDLVNPIAKQERVIAYATARFTPGANKYDLIIPLVGNANSGSVVPVDISGLETKTQNLNATSSLNTLTKNTDIRLFQSEKLRILNDTDDTEKFIVNNTNVLSYVDIYSNKFIINSGPSPAGYLMSDGTILNSSSTNNNSNIYLYNSNTTTTAPPLSSQIRFNNSVQQNATTIWISHMTRDSIDIDPFLALISQLSVLYIQDQDSSVNYIKYNVNTTPTITPNSYVTISVTFIEGGGTGLTNFPNGMNIFLSLFTNDVEIDTRLSTVENKTQNITSANSSLTTFSKNLNVYLSSGGYFGIRSSDGLTNYMVVEPTISNVYNVLNMNSQKITSVGTATAGTDATNKTYVDTLGATKLDKSTIVANALPYINSSNQITSNGSNLYCQAGVDNLQTIYNTIEKGQSYSIQLSSGTHGINGLTVSDTDVIIKGVEAPVASTFINADIAGMTIGSNSVITQRLQFQNIRFLSIITFNSSSSQALRHTFENCDFSNTVTFPSTITSESDLYVNFNNCKFSYFAGITFPNTAGVYTFDNCVFSNNIISNNNTVAGRIIFKNCSGLNSLAVNNVSYVGVNILETGISTLTATTIKLGGLNTSFLMSNGDENANSYVNAGLTQPANGLPYYDANSKLNGTNLDKFIVSGGTTIQTAINTVTVGTVIRLGSSAWIESVNCINQNYTLCGAPCPIGAQTTQITGNLTIGSASPSQAQTRVRLRDIKLIGNISFNGNSTYQELRTYFDNMDISGTVTFPTLVATASGLAIYFNNCSFSGSNATLMTIPNQALYSIYFTNCQFNNQSIVNNLTAGNTMRLIFTNCSIMNSIALTNCIYNGLNSSAVASQLTAGSIKLGGLASQFLMADGSSNNAVYSTISSTFFSLTIAGTTTTVSMRKIHNGTTGTVTLYIGGFSGTAASTATVLLSTNAIADTTYRPGVNLTFPCRIKKLSTNQMGTLIIFSNGTIGLTDVVETSNFWSSGNTGCGIVGDTCVSYTL